MESHEPRQDRPETYVPSTKVLVVLVQRMPGISLRRLCLAVWPGLDWQHAASIMYEWQAPYGPGNRVHRQPAGAWLRDRLEDLIARGELRHGRRLREEADALASITYYPAG